MPNARPVTAPARPSRRKPPFAIASLPTAAPGRSAGTMLSPSCSPCRPTMPRGRRLAGGSAQYRHRRSAPGHRRPRPIRTRRHRTTAWLRTRLIRNEVGNFQSAHLGRIQSALTPLASTCSWWLRSRLVCCSQTRSAKTCARAGQCAGHGRPAASVWSRPCCWAPRSRAVARQRPLRDSAQQPWRRRDPGRTRRRR